MGGGGGGENKMQKHGGYSKEAKSTNRGSILISTRRSKSVYSCLATSMRIGR